MTVIIADVANTLMRVSVKQKCFQFVTLWLSYCYIANWISWCCWTKLRCVMWQHHLWCWLVACIILQYQPIHVCRFLPTMQNTSRDIRAVKWLCKLQCSQTQPKILLALVHHFYRLFFEKHILQYFHENGLEYEYDSCFVYLLNFCLFFMSAYSFDIKFVCVCLLLLTDQI